MLELPVTALHAHVNPTIIFKQLDDFANLHGYGFYAVAVLPRLF
jgi:hypothetical protein